MSLFKTAALAAMLCVPMAVASASDDERKPIERRPAGEPKTDLEFLAQAIACEVANVKFAEKAAKNATSEDVRKLANTVAEDHKKVRDNLLEQAKKMRLGVVEGLAKEHREQYDKMAKLEGREFDRAYVKCLADGHEKSVKMYTTWAKDAKDAGVREAAEAALTNAKAHAEKVKALNAKFKE